MFVDGIFRGYVALIVAIPTFLGIAFLVTR